MRKKLIAILLVLVALLSISPVQVAAAPPQEDLLPRMQECMKIVANSVTVLEDDLKGGALSAGPGDIVAALQGAFTNFLSFAKTGAPVLSLVTGGVTFLRMIGVMEDPTQTALGRILDQLETMDQKISEINGKVDVITAQISAMQATEAFHNRGRKADTLNGYWRNFDSLYMENGLDKLMSDYDAMVLNGLQDWFTNPAEDARTQGNVDNTQLVLVYSLNDRGDYQLTFSPDNGLPAGLAETDRYCLIKSDCLPRSGEISWNVNTYRQAFIAFVSPLIESALRDGTDAVETNYFTAADAEKLAADAVDTLISRVACTQINKDASFAAEVNRQFTNYCTHLLSSEDGLDAMFKTLYLTHAFQFQIREDLQKFCDRMIVKTGTYGAFVTNVLSMSRSMSETTQLAAADRFCDTIEAMDNAKARCLASAYDQQGNFYRYYDNYCYITNSQLYFVDMSLDTEVTVYTERSSNKATYLSYDAKGFTLTPGTELPERSVLLDDTNTLHLFYTLKSNGVTGDYPTYFKENGDIARGVTNVPDRGCLLTGYSAPQDLPLDGATLLRCRLVIGNDDDYFMDYHNRDLTIKSSDMPGDTEVEYMVYHKKAVGSVYDMNTGVLSTGQTLLAAAAYGESHTLWRIDESALFAGPSNAANFDSQVYSGSQWDDYADKLVASRKFNALYAVPVPQNAFGASGYDPLSSFRALSSQLNAPAQSGDIPTTATPDSPQTADLMSLPLYGTLLFVGCLGVGTVLIHRKKRN